MPSVGDNESKLLVSINSSLIMGDPFIVLLWEQWATGYVIVYPPHSWRRFSPSTMSTCARIEILTMHQVLVGCMSFNSIVCTSVCVCECAYMYVCMCVCMVEWGISLWFCGLCVLLWLAPWLYMTWPGLGWSWPDRKMCQP